MGDITNIDGKEVQISVSRTYLGKTKTKQEKIMVRPFVTSTATVGVKIGRTINIGNYENVKLEVFVASPCYKEEIVETYTQVKNLTETLLGDEIEKIVGSDGDK